MQRMDSDDEMEPVPGVVRLYDTNGTSQRVASPALRVVHPPGGAIRHVIGRPVIVSEHVPAFPREMPKHDYSSAWQKAQRRFAIGLCVGIALAVAMIGLILLAAWLAG